jgi:SUN domain-containing protein 1/2
VEQSVITTITSGGTRRRKQGPLTKAKSRPSNAYGASGRVGAAEELLVPATGFASAFHERRGNAVTRDDESEDEEGDESDSDDELAHDFMMSGALHGTDGRRSPVHERSSPPRGPANFALSGTPDLPFTDDDPAISIGATSKSFGMEHEAGMLQESQRRTFLRSSSQQPTPAARGNLRLARQVATEHTTVKSTPHQPAIGKSVDKPLADERARLQREGPPRPTIASQSASRPAVNPTPRARVPAQFQVKPRAMPPPRSPIERQPEQRGDVPAPQQNSGRGPAQKPAHGPLDRVRHWLTRVEPSNDTPDREIHDDDDDDDDAEWLWWPMLRSVFWGFAAFIGVLLLASMLSAAGFSDPSRKVGLHTAIGKRLSTAYYDLAEWIEPGERVPNKTQALLTWKWGDGSLDDNLMWSRMWKNHNEYVAKFEDVESAIDKKYHGINSAIDKIKEDLPMLIVIRRHPDERLEITDDFWNALLSKAQSKSDDATWMQFLKANSQKVQSLDSRPIDTSTARPQIINRDEFADAMRKQYAILSGDIERKIAEALKTQETQIKSLIHDEIRKARMDSIRLQSLAQSNLLANYELNLKKHNYFSTGLGALIEPGLTSSTHDGRSSSFASRHLSWLTGRYLSIGRRANPPIAALARWDEFGECWCAAPNPIRGYAQLGVTLPRRMFPKQVTVEHAPISMSPSGNIKNAPRTIELWAKTDQPIKHVYGQSHTDCMDPNGLVGQGYVCLGDFKYDIYGANHVQTFNLDAELTIPTARVVVQVTSNWGAPNTCIYRVRLHGDDAEEAPEYDVTLNDKVQAPV